MVQPVKFDTTKTQPVTPGLITPSRVGPDKSALYKPNTLSFVNSLIKAGVETSDQLQTRDATDKAYELANMYNEQSPTNTMALLNEQERLKQELSMATDANKDAFTQQLNDVTNRLLRARAQGMSPYEFSRRVNKELNDLSAGNPGRGAQLAQVMNQVFVQTGVSDNIKFDTDLMKARNDAAIKRQETMVKKVEEYMPTYGMDEDDLIKNYNNIITVEGKTKEYELLLKNKDKIKLLEKDQFFESIGGIKGLTKWRQVAFNSITTDLTNILAGPEDFATKKALASAVFEKHESFLLETYSRLPQNESNKEAIGKFLEKNQAMLEAMKAKFDKDITLEDFKTYKNNLKIIQESDDYSEMRAKYGNPKELNLLSQLITVMGSEMKLMGQLNLDLNDLGKRITDLTTAKFDKANFTSDTIDLMQSTNGSPLNSLVTSVSSQYEAGNEITNTEYGLAVNQLSTLDTMSGQNKLVYFDSVMRTLSNTKPEFLDALIEDAGYKGLLTSKMAEYNTNNVTNLQNIMNKSGIQAITNVYYNDVKGQIAHADPMMNSQLRRINWLIKLAATIEGTTPDKIAPQFLELYYPFLQIDNMPMQEETK